MKSRLCAWGCGQKTARHCGICLECCEARDKLDRDIDAGRAKYIPPNERPGHRFYERAQMQKARRAKTA